MPVYRKESDMKHMWTRAAACLMAVSLTASLLAACGKSHKEPADSLIASETYVNATVPEMQEDAVEEIAQQILGDDVEFDGNYDNLNQSQKQQLKQALQEKGYTTDIKNGKIVYYSYTPTADQKEIAEVVRKVRGDDSWDGQYQSLSKEEKQQVQTELQARGYDVEPAAGGFRFYNEADRRAETTRSSYNRLPTKEQLSAVLNDILGLDGFKKWNGKFTSLTADQQRQMLDMLNEYGFDLALDKDGWLYIVHAPENKMTYDSAYTAAELGSTTMPSTTIVTTTSADTPTENVTGTTAAKEEPGIAIAQEALSTFGTARSSMRKVIPTADGGFMTIVFFHDASGAFADTDAGYKFTRSALVKLDKNGRYVWKAVFGTKSARQQGVWLEDVTQLTDGSFVAVGYTDGKDFADRKDKKTDELDGLIVKVSESGDILWQKLQYGTENDLYYSVAAAPDGGFVTGAQTESSDVSFETLANGVRKAVLQKWSADGAVQWANALNSGSYACQIRGIAVTDAGAIYVAYYAAGGTTLQMDMSQLAGYGAADSIVIKYDANGGMIAHRAIAGSGSDEVTCISLAEGGGVIVGGNFTKNVRDDSVFAGKANQGKSDAFLVRLDARLDVQWVKTFGGADRDSITGITEIRGGFAVCGSSASSNDAFDFLGSGTYDAFVLTVTDNGTGVSKYAIGSSNDDEALGIAASGGRHAVVVGLTHGANNHFLGLEPAGANGKSVCFIEMLKLG